MLNERAFVNDALILIPAAGYGTRVRTVQDCATPSASPDCKEMLSRPDYNHMIDFALDIAARLHVAAHVITRKDKVSLAAHLERRQREQPLTFQFVEPTREWPESILVSEPHWRMRNLVVLPDSDFTPEAIAGEMIEALASAQTVWALFEASAEQCRSYGVVDTKLNRHAEKPLDSNGAQPWGVFGFRREVGRNLCANLLESTLTPPRNDAHKWFNLPKSSLYFALAHYKDLTR